MKTGKQRKEKRSGIKNTNFLLMRIASISLNRRLSSRKQTFDVLFPSKHRVRRIKKFGAVDATGNVTITLSGWKAVGSASHKTADES